MLSTSSKCCGGLHVEEQNPFVRKESRGGFLPRYVLLSFQDLTPLSCKPKADFSVWNKTTPTLGQTWENSPFKGGWLKIGSDRREGWTRIPKTLISSQETHSLIFVHWIGWRDCPRMSIFDQEWYWTPRSGFRLETEMREAASSERIMLNPRGELMTKALWRTWEWADVRANQEWNLRGFSGRKSSQ